MKALLKFVVGDDIRLAIIAVIAVLVMWHFHTAPLTWLWFPAVIATAIVTCVTYRPR